MLISVNVPGNLMDVSNGRLRSVVKQKNKTKTYNWFVANPIDNYGVNINIADYAHFLKYLMERKGSLIVIIMYLRKILRKRNFSSGRRL